MPDPEPTPTISADALGEYAEHPAFKDRMPADVKTLAKRVVDSQAEIDRRVRIPGKDATDDERTAFYTRLQTIPGVAKLPGEGEDAAAFFQKLGAPESPDGYKPPSEELADVAKELAPTAHGLGLTTRQFEGLLGKIGEQRAQKLDQQTQTAEKARSTLQQKWGDAYAEKMAHVRIAAEQEGVTDLLERNPEYGNSTPLLEMLAEQGKKLAESESISTVVAAGAGIMTPGELEAKRAAIYADKNHPFNNRMSPAHKQAVADMLKINAKLEGYKTASR